MIFRDCTFSYGEKRILDHFTLELPDRGITALSGPSGCGKTTLLRLLAGVEQLDSGDLEAPAPGDCGMLFQENRLLPGLTAMEQLRPVLPRGASPLPYLIAVGLEGEENTLPAALSGGMRRRLAIARLLAYGETKSLLLLDEPFTGIDAPRAAGIMEWIREKGRPVIMAAHDAESLALADQVIALDGPPLNIIN